MITQDDVIYLIVTDRFADGDPENNFRVDRSSPRRRHGGDLLGVVRRMPYLRALGVTTLWLTPVYLNPVNAYHGYHPLDFERVDPHLTSPELGPGGSRKAYRRFVEIAHEHGLKVIFDAVVNHTAPDHPWLKERPDWFNPDVPHGDRRWLWGLPDLNHNNAEVNLFLTRNILDWITSCRVDAVRLDAAGHVDSEFWHMLKLFAHGLAPEVPLLGEVWSEDVDTVAAYQTHHGFDMMFDFPLQAAIADVFTRDAPFRRIAGAELCEDEPPGVLDRDRAYRNAYRLVTFIDNHDMPRFLRKAGGMRRRLLAMQRTRLALTFLFTTRGIPQLYYGTELAMDGGRDPDNRRDMAWPLIDGAGTESAAAARAHEMFRFTHDLIRLRRGSMALRYGLLVTAYVTPTLYAYFRIYPGDFRLVVLNNSDETAHASLPLGPNPRLPLLAREYLREGRQMQNDLHPGDRVQVVNGHLRVRVQPRSGAVYRGLV